MYIFIWLLRESNQLKHELELGKYFILYQFLFNEAYKGIK